MIGGWISRSGKLGFFLKMVYASAVWKAQPRYSLIQPLINRMSSRLLFLVIWKHIAITALPDFSLGMWEIFFTPCHGLEQKWTPADFKMNTGPICYKKLIYFEPQTSVIVHNPLSQCIWGGGGAYQLCNSRGCGFPEKSSVFWFTLFFHSSYPACSRQSINHPCHKSTSQLSLPVPFGVCVTEKTVEFLTGPNVSNIITTHCIVTNHSHLHRVHCEVRTKPGLVIEMAQLLFKAFVISSCP